MLQLKRVDIQGFKSFYDRTEMRFHGSGIAAIVGPNGCGKSNISDAISWVLGEQSAKSLRGSRMEDVIFAGTRERKPLGMAQVTLTMVDPAAAHRAPDQAQNGHANGNGHAPHKPAEVTITRRLYRSGESEYLIDGQIRAVARHPGAVQRHGTGPGELRHHRAGPHRPDSFEQAGRPPRRSSKKPRVSANTKRASVWPKPSWRARSRIFRACSTFWKRSAAR